MFYFVWVFFVFFISISCVWPTLWIFCWAYDKILQKHSSNKKQYLRNCINCHRIVWATLWRQKDIQATFKLLYLILTKFIFLFFCVIGILTLESQNKFELGLCRASYLPLIPYVCTRYYKILQDSILCVILFFFVLWDPAHSTILLKTKCAFVLNLAANFRSFTSILCRNWQVNKVIQKFGRWSCNLFCWKLY